MQANHLELTDFRSYPALELAPQAGLNVLVGENAQGKSNVLEALYVLATTKSARAGRDSEMVRFGCPLARVAGRVERVKEIDVTLELLFSATDKKLARVNGVKQTKLADVIGRVNAALFHAEDLEIIRGEPAMRRRFLDLEIAQTSPRYVGALAAYRKTLEQRNALLRQMRDSGGRFRRRSYSYSYPGGEADGGEYGAGGDGDAAQGVLSAWDEQLAQHGAVIVERRIAFVERLSTLAAELHHELSDTRDELALAYQPSIQVDGARLASEIQGAFLRQLKSMCEEEAFRGKTMIGPQRDDLLLSVNGRDSRLYASQGQQRTIALSLKLAERRLIEELVGEPPLLLLDDVLSDLDDVRRRKLFDQIARSRSQTFLTCTNLRSVPQALMADGAAWRVERGAVARE